MEDGYKATDTVLREGIIYWRLTHSSMMSTMFECRKKGEKGLLGQPLEAEVVWV